MLFIDFSLTIEQMKIDARIDYVNELYNVLPGNFVTHKHTVYEVFLIENGSMVVSCQEQLIELKEHDILMIPPNMKHNIVSCSSDLKRFTFSFVFRDFAKLTPNFSYKLYRPDENIKTEIFQNIAHMHQHLTEKISHLNYFLVKTYFSIILHYIVDQIVPPKTELTDEMKIWTAQHNKLVNCIKIDDFFRKHFHEILTVKDLATELNYSITHTNRLLQSYTGMSFSAKLQQTRLAFAIEKLSHTKMPISQIAEECGYATLRGFELFFYKQMKMLPSEYRKHFDKS